MLINEHRAFALAARELAQLRNNWLNPPEWTTTEILEFPGTVGGPWDRYIDSHGGVSPKLPNSRVSERRDHMPEIRTVEYPCTIPRDEQSAKELKKRTLTNLYNQRPTWLDLAHRRLDEAVFAAYGWSPTMTDDELLAALLELNLRRAADASAG